MLRRLSEAVIDGASRNEQVASAIVVQEAVRCGLAADVATGLGGATAAVVTAVYQRGFPDGVVGDVTVRVLRDHDSLVVQVDDLGLPFNFAAEDAVDRDVIADAVANGWLSGFRHVPRGRDGNRTVLSVRRPTDPGDLGPGDVGPGDVDPVVTESHPPPAPDGPVHDGPVTVRRAHAGDADAIVRLTWRTYGFGYWFDEFYDREQLGVLLEDGTLVSFVAVTDDGDVVGHFAYAVDDPDAVVVDSGRWMVDPRFRGRHILETVATEASGWLTERGIVGVVIEAVTAHTRSQTLVLPAPYGHSPTGMLVNLSPPAAAFKGIDASATGRRQTVVPIYSLERPHEPQRVHLPDADAPLIRRIYERLGLEREVAADGRAPDTGTASVIDTHVNHDLAALYLRVDTVGDDLASAARARIDHARELGVEVLNVALRLDAPEVAWAAEQLRQLGFVFGEVQPMRIPPGVDAVVFQHWGTTVVDRDDIHLADPFATELLDYVLEQRDAAPI